MPLHGEQVPSAGPSLLGSPFPPINTPHFSSSFTPTNAMEGSKEEKMQKSTEGENQSTEDLPIV